MSGQIDDMYREIILEHFRSPRGKNPLQKVDISSEGQNPACGDEIDMQVELENDIVKNIYVGCRGCAISVASGSMLAELVKGKSLQEINRITDIVRKMLKGELNEIPDDLGDIDALQGVRQFPVRVKCALLSWMTLIEGINNYMQGKSDRTPVVTTEVE